MEKYKVSAYKDGLMVSNTLSTTRTLEQIKAMMDGAIATRPDKCDQYMVWSVKDIGLLKDQTGDVVYNSHNG